MPCLPRTAIALLATLPLGVSDAAPSAAPTMNELANLSYRGIYEQPITLKDGVYEGAPLVRGGAARRRVQLAQQLNLVGDLDGDGDPDAAVVLTESSGGSGENTYLAIVGRRDADLENLATKLIGDRVQIRSLRIEQGALVMDLVAAGPEEPMCCPTLMLRNTYRLAGDQLVEGSSEKLGHLSLSDLQGVTWRLTHLGRHKPLPAGIEVTAVFSPERVTGIAACNRYFADIMGKGPRDISIGPVGATRMACPPAVMEVESHYLRALESVTQLGFLLGQLALTYRDGDALETLLFDSQR